MGLVLAGILAATAVMSGCSSKADADTKDSAVLTAKELLPLAQKEGNLVSVGMPDSWANWKGTWDDLKSKYNINHTDTDMSSAEELAKFESEKNSPPDIGDVGISFGPIAEQKGLTLKYKTEYWDDVPAWAKDDDGDWMVGYTGTISFLTNKSLVKNPPKSWADLKNGDYKVVVGDVTKASQAQNAVLAAAIAFGGSETNLQPGLDFFADLAKQDRISKVDATLANLQKGEVQVVILWDFNALGYRDQIDPAKFEVHVPSEGSVISGYASVINKNAKNPNAAKLARNYIFSDEGQINLAKGYARPIRSSVKLPEDVSAKLINNDEYKNVKPIQDYKAWEKAIKELPQLWLEQVQSKIK
ncbi:ABC transporter substrate-binding protein [Gorillibacterium massiliense]|uniref:ABC transporter substrate-binding protein n=1 Tax=Gorillibacterium massiliense TaxID=1280390 RepID=UPI0006948D11